jgi:hypothetical protein
MTRPKGSKKSLSPLPSLQTSMNDFINPIINKGGRPKKTDDDISTNSLNEISGGGGGRVVINPAVLRYLEQTRNYSLITNKIEDTSMDINEEKDDNSFDDLSNELIEFDNLFWDFCACSTEFLTTARLAQWILNHQQSEKLIN